MRSLIARSRILGESFAILRVAKLNILTRYAAYLSDLTCMTTIVIRISDYREIELIYLIFIHAGHWSGYLWTF